MDIQGRVGRVYSPRQATHDHTVRVDLAEFVGWGKHGTGDPDYMGRCKKNFFYKYFG